jgi:RNAse (barnase) inhibitor barstar
MDLSRLTRPAPPWFYSLAATPEAARDALLALERAGGERAAVRFIRGRKAGTATAFFDEASAALQFPDYFGANWDAFHDCLDDLGWLSADAVVLVLLDADKLLPADETAKHLAKVLKAVTERRNKAGKGRDARPCHVVLQAAPAVADVALQRWHALGLPAQRL